jgi:predicted nucleic acid-binding protein
MFLDTSSLVGALAGERPYEGTLVKVLATNREVRLSSLVLFEWLRGPRLASEINLQEQLFPTARIVPFGIDEARLAAELYRGVRSPRAREMDIGIAACAILRNAPLWTLNTRDFADIPGLRLAQIH